MLDGDGGNFEKIAAGRVRLLFCLQLKGVSAASSTIGEPVAVCRGSDSGRLLRQPCLAQASTYRARSSALRTRRLASPDTFAAIYRTSAAAAAPSAARISEARGKGTIAYRVRRQHDRPCRPRRLLRLAEQVAKAIGRASRRAIEAQAIAACRTCSPRASGLPSHPPRRESPRWTGHAVQLPATFPVAAVTSALRSRARSSVATSSETRPKALALVSKNAASASAGA